MGDPGLHLKHLREQRGFSLRGFAAEIGCSASTLSRAENGHFEDTSFGVIKRAARILNVTVDELYTSNVSRCPTCGGRGWIIQREGGE